MIPTSVAGPGLCQRPRSLFHDDIEAGGLVEVLHTYEPKALDVHVVWPKARYGVDERVKLCAHWQ